MTVFDGQVQWHFAISLNQVRFGPGIKIFFKRFEYLMTLFKRNLRIHHFSFPGTFHKADDFITKFLNIGCRVGYGYITG